MRTVGCEEDVESVCPENLGNNRENQQIFHDGSDRNVKNNPRRVVVIPPLHNKVEDERSGA